MLTDFVPIVPWPILRRAEDRWSSFSSITMSRVDVVARVGERINSEEFRSLDSFRVAPLRLRLGAFFMPGCVRMHCDGHDPRHLCGPPVARRSKQWEETQWLGQTRQLRSPS